MGCCSSNLSVSIGCKNFCSSIDLGYNSVQNGTHSVEVFVSNGTVNSISLGSLTIGDDLIIPENSLNENKEQYIQVLQPDSTYYEFETGIYCIRLTTQILTSN